MKQQVFGGATSRSEYVVIRDVNGNPITGLVYNSSGLIAYYVLPLANSASITLATQTVTGAWSSGGFVEVDSTHCPGLYRFDIPNAVFAGGDDKAFVYLSGYTGMSALPIEYMITAYNPNDSVRLGLTALPNASAASGGGLPTVGTGASQIDVDSSGRVNVSKWLGTAVTAATAGVPDVNAARINNVSASSVTTINANIGVTQPVNFTGTGASALVKSDMVDVAGSAVSTTTAQIGVNAVQLGGTAQTGRDIGASVLLSAGTGTGQLDFTSGVVKSSLVQILGTALTETAGQIAAAFKQFFNIASPTSTMNLITAVGTLTTYTGNTPQTGDAYAIVNSGTFGNAQLVRSTTPANTLTVDSSHRVAEVALVDTLTTYTGNTVQSGDAYAVVNNGTYGNAQLVRSTTPANTLTVDSSHRVAEVALVDTLTTYTGNTVQTGDAYAVVNNGTYGNAQLVRSTTPANTLTVDSSHRVAEVALTDTLTTYTGNTPQTGDSFARLGAPAGASVSADVAALKTDLDAGVKVSVGTGAGQINASGGKVPATLSTSDVTGTLAVNASQIGGQAVSLDTNNLLKVDAEDWKGAAAPAMPANFSSLAITSGGAVTAGTVNDKSGYSLTSGEHTNISADAAAALTAQGYTTTRAGYLDTLNGLVTAIWAAATRTLTSFGTLASDAATAVWSAVTRTLTAGSSPTAAQIATEIFTHDLSTVSGEAAKSLLNAVRGLGTINKVVVDYVGGTIQVFKEDGVSVAYSIPIQTQSNVTKTIVEVY